VIPKHSSNVASPKVWGGKYFDFKQTTVFCLVGHRLSRHKTIGYARNSEGVVPWLRLWAQVLGEL